MVKTWEDLEYSYPECRSYMSEEREREFLTHCYRLYRNEGFADTFETIYEDSKKHNGKTFEVLKELWDNKHTDIQALPIWMIKLECGEQIQAFAEEICKSERL
jgi:hypothetical protein